MMPFLLIYNILGTVLKISLKIKNKKNCSLFPILLKAKWYSTCLMYRSWKCDCGIGRDPQTASWRLWDIKLSFVGKIYVSFSHNTLWSFLDGWNFYFKRLEFHTQEKASETIPKALERRNVSEATQIILTSKEKKISILIILKY